MNGLLGMATPPYAMQTVCRLARARVRVRIGLGLGRVAGRVP